MCCRPRRSDPFETAAATVIFKRDQFHADRTPETGHSHSASLLWTSGSGSARRVLGKITTTLLMKGKRMKF